MGAVLHPGSAPPPYRPEHHFPAAAEVRLPPWMLHSGTQPRRLDGGSGRAGALGMFAERLTQDWTRAVWTQTATLLEEDWVGVGASLRSPT